MANMGYCRFQNTLSDLQDCYRALDNGERLSEDEEEAALALLDLAKKMAGRFEASDLRSESEDE